jgi:N-acetylmuramoyl-L-alanine amidase
MEIIEHLLPYQDRLKIRGTGALGLIVLHCTELPTLQLAREYGERLVHPESGTGNSGHYYVDRDGRIYRYVQDNRIAHHAIGHNEHSIGIEIVNSGRYPHWYSSRNQVPSEPYATIQIAALKELLRYLKQRYPQINRLARHSDLDTALLPAEDDPAVAIRRKIDPGPLFPWEEIQNWWLSL